MLRRILFLSVILLAVSCAPTRIVAPLEQGQKQVGVSMGRPQINDGSLPLLGIYGAKGVTNSKTIFGGAQLTGMMLGTLQFDGGVVKSIGPKNAEGLGVSWNYGANAFISARDGAFRLYPESGINGYYKVGPHYLYASANSWLDPTFFMTRYGKGLPLAPNFGAGYRLRYRWVELQAEYKILNPIKDIVVPQAYVPGVAGMGGRGWYFGAAVNF